MFSILGIDVHPKLGVIRDSLILAVLCSSVSNVAHSQEERLGRVTALSLDQAIAGEIHFEFSESFSEEQCDNKLLLLTEDRGIDEVLYAGVIGAFFTQQEVRLKVIAESQPASAQTTVPCRASELAIGAGI